MSLLSVDALSLIITVVGWLIVFGVLLVLVFVFTLVPKIYSFVVKQNLKRQGKIETANLMDEGKPMSGDENAAIAMAIHLFLNEMHDEESNVITIKRTERRYSPWSSKIYGLNNANFPK